jgi:hypothetical protein
VRCDWSVHQAARVKPDSPFGNKRAYFNAKSAKKNTEGAKQVEGRDRNLKEYLRLLCSSLRFLRFSSARSVVAAHTSDLV